ncbi:Methylsuccinyl-CoA dehydrogenase, predicted by (Erb et al, 2007) [invertebrate metagenome]|uniref:Methylsuccinyl-CoA dehydrogenase, predicted by (Erb et al, 2007) n=1 Tax=invertebrate metagenome TaxID=1711999 RepID=A0A484H812_9ZZZZ
MPELMHNCEQAVAKIHSVLESARRHLLALVSKDGKIDAALFEQHQYATHGFAWLATYVYALREMLHWARRLDEAGEFTELEQLLLQSSFAEYLHQIYGGIPMSQNEFVRPADFGIETRERLSLQDPHTNTLRDHGATPDVYAHLSNLIHDGSFGNPGLGDETLTIIRDQFYNFVEDRISPLAHDWHLRDDMIPMEIVEELATLGVFGLTIPEAYGGLGLSKMAMVVVTEELSRGYIGVGSLGTRSEIAAELISGGGTEEQKRNILPGLAAGTILPTAVFTEPNTGSDLAALNTRAVREGDDYVVTGNKTWITHAARTDLMTLLVRTNSNDKSYRGLSMLLASKPRGSDTDPFPASGMSGSEIPVLGYRGMKEYELSFDGFKVPSTNLLGGKEGEGFKQLMTTFEAARIQTAARAVGVAQNAMEEGMKYAKERIQFGKPIYTFPRVYGKVARMAVETMVARQLTYFAAREKDGQRRCDIEAGMAKLLAARVAWSNADNALQCHGGNGYAQEYEISRVLCDARILNIFEGAAEIQAQVVARGLLGR